MNDIKTWQERAKDAGEHPCSADGRVVFHMQSELIDLRAALAARATPAQPVPKGWKLVPIEPTLEMCQAARKVPEPVKPYPPHFHLIWDAMLAAAPSIAQDGQKSEGA